MKAEFAFAAGLQRRSFGLVHENTDTAHVSMLRTANAPSLTVFFMPSIVGQGAHAVIDAMKGRRIVEKRAAAHKV